jgi:nucleotide sugar dehydrogenase
MTTESITRADLAHETAAPRRYRDELTAGHCAASVWGLGHIGSSTAEALLEVDLRVVGYDIDPRRVAALAAQYDGRPAALSTDAAHALADEVAVHFVAVPTERQAEPYLDALVGVMTLIIDGVAARSERAAPPLVIIESTLTPGTVEQRIMPLILEAGLRPDIDLLLSLAPRRDWFIAEGYGLRDLDRIYSGIGPNSADAAYGVLSLLCDVLHRAPSHIEGELVKCVENAYRHVEITLANQLTLGYPNVDMLEVLRLAGTKWNIGTFHPSFGTGGYCIPLSSRYLLAGAEKADELSLLSRTVESDMRMRAIVAEAASAGAPVVILGLAYKGGIKVATLSPTIEIVRCLSDAGVPYGVFDPIYTSDEINTILGAEVAIDDLPTAVREAGAVLVVPDHLEFRGEPYLGLLTADRDSPLLVMDNLGVLADVQWPGHVHYRRAGSAGWLQGQTALGGS